MNWLKTLGKVGKGLGLLAAGGALDALTGGQVAAVLAPLGPLAPLAALGLQAAVTAGLDYLKHKDKDKEKE